MVVLAVGDVVGDGGRVFLKKHLKKIKADFQADVCIVNGENSADGNGIDKNAAEEIFDAGADVITTGNHSFQKRSVYEYFDDCKYLIRPLNYPGGCPGRGDVLFETNQGNVLVLNLMGTAFLEPLANPFLEVDKVLKSHHADIVIVDFHAEATSEKLAMGYYLDGRVSAIFGTHTHVQTADEQIFPNGTGYITDIGMTGPRLSVLGLEPKQVIEKFSSNMPQRFSTSKNPVELCGAVFEIDNATKKTTKVYRVKVSE